MYNNPYARIGREKKQYLISFEDRESGSRTLFADVSIYDCPSPLKLLGSLVLMVKLQLAPLSFMLLRQIRSSRVQARTGLERSSITIPNFTRRWLKRYDWNNIVRISTVK